MTMSTAMTITATATTKAKAAATATAATATEPALARGRLDRRVHVRLQHRTHEAVDRMRLENRRVGARASEPLRRHRRLHLLVGLAAAIDPQHIDAAVGVRG